jgi:beta-galactosidase
MSSKRSGIPAAGGSDGIYRRDALRVVAGLVALPAGGNVAEEQTSAVAAALGDNQRAQPFDGEWRFYRGDLDGAERNEFDDRRWRLVDLPHDFSVENLPPRPEETSGAGALWGPTSLAPRVGPFDRERSEGGRNTGWVVGGTGWYRKHFIAAGIPAGRRVSVLFEGVYMNADVWLNGHHLGNHPYGYTGFEFDLTPHLSRDGSNVLAVRVRNEGRNSRWYSGSGIYRHVWMSVTGEVRVPLWGVFVTTPAVSREAATVMVAVRVENRGDTAREVTLRTRLVDSKGTSAATHDTSLPVAAGGEVTVEQTLDVKSPQLWSTAAPRLYNAVVELMADGRVVDRTSTPFGIRKVEVDAERGLRLNGEALKLRGGCMHHDNGLLGSAAFDRAEERRVQLMKENGFNAIRTSHNPPSPAFLDACDRLGMLVLDEAFDAWERQKNARDYHLYFDDWWRRDLDAMVLRDRNHPSVIFWSIGNEIPEFSTPRGVELAKQMSGYVRQLDPTRPVTEAINAIFARGPLDAAFESLDVGGYNYMRRQYESDHERQPARVMVGTESFPIEAFENWKLIEKHPYIIGDFVWTAMDYLGEIAIGCAQLNQAAMFDVPPDLLPPGVTLPAPGANPPAGGPANPLGDFMPAGTSGFLSLDYPWFNAYCGDIDIIGETKPQFWYKRVLWGLDKLAMAVQRPVPDRRQEQLSMWGWSDELKSWTWPGFEGEKIRVRTYSTGDQIRLLLNGKELGVKPVSSETKLTAEFEVPYEAGELKAIALQNGVEIATLAYRTAGRPARLRLNADRTTIRRTRSDLAYVTVDVLDGSGHLVPDAAVPVQFAIAGPGELAATGSANPKDVESFRNPKPKTFHGKCLAIVRPAGRPGTVTLSAHAAGLPPVSIALNVS